MLQQANAESFLEWLVQHRVLAESQLARARERAAESGRPVEQLVVELGFASEARLAEARGQMLGVRVVDLKTFPISPEAMALVPEAVAREHDLLPIVQTKDGLTVAMADPFDVQGIAAVEFASRSRVDAVLAGRGAIREGISRFYGVFGQIEELARQVQQEGRGGGAAEAGEEGALLSAEGDAQAGPVVRLVRLILTQGVHSGASDIHIEPQEGACRVRFRVDGILREVLSFDKALQAAILSSTKIMAQMDIAEKRLPQDGRFRLQAAGRTVDLRVSAFPGIHGEKIVLRILDKEGAKLSLEEIGMAPVDLQQLLRAVTLPYGLVLVTGPTGSGKTTTLYSVLNRINDVKKNITTLEDPVEYQLGGAITQAQVNPKAGFSFARGLRAILRQDPNIILVGEIRDQETAEIAIQSALTGHLVLSTLHTNSAPGAVARLLDMGVEPFLIGSSLEGVLGQRLVRRVCAKCKEPYVPDAALRAKLGLPEEFAGKLHRAPGCRVCHRTGYAGRVGIFEIFRPEGDLREMIVRRAPTDELKRRALELGMRTMHDDGMDKAVRGLTTVEEVVRMVGLDTT